MQHLFLSNQMERHMYAQRIISQVDEKGFLHIDTNQPKGTTLEIIVRSIDEQKPQTDAKSLSDTSALMAMQASGGFVSTILASAEEDVWNDA
jgi:hypothetical protein